MLKKLSFSRVMTALALMTAVAAFTCASALAQTMPDAENGQIKMALIPVLSGYPAGETLAVPVMLVLPRGMVMLPPSSGRSLRYAVKDAQAFKVSGLNLAPNSDPGSGYRGMLIMEFMVSISTDLEPGVHKLEGSLLLPLEGQEKPLKVDFGLPVNVLAKGAEPKVMNPQMLAALLGQLKASMGGEAGTPTAQSGEPGPGPDSGQDDPYAGESFWWILLGVFLGGLGLNLTPCVFPMIPITVSFFGGRAGGAKSQLIIHSSVYLLGLVLTYTILGAFVSLSGRMLGEALTNPWVTGGASLIILIMASSMFGLWEIRMPASLNRLAATDRAGLLGSLIMGLTVGILAAPCVGPFVVGLMTHVARVGEIGYGLMLFALLSLGLGLPLSILAVFSGALANLPRAGDWMIWVRKFFGVILVIMAVYVSETLLGPEIYPWVMAAAALVGAVYLAFVDKSGQGGFKMVKRLGALALVLGVGVYFWMVTPTLRNLVIGESGSTHIAWQKFSPEILKQAAADGKPVMIDFSADWCAPCKRMESETFPDKRVVDGLEGFVTLRADVTKGASDELKPYAQKWGIRGVPSLIFLDRSGKTMSDMSLVGYRGPDDLAAHLKNVRQKLE